MLGWLCNTFTNALAEQNRLPKAIIVVLDNDIIKYANWNIFGMSVIYGRLLHFLFSEFNRQISAKKDYLLKKAIRNGLPHVLWINPPFHTNFPDNPQRAKFGKCLDRTATLYPNMWSLKLKKIWNSQDTSLYLKDAGHFTATGLMTYWMAIDRMVKFWDTALVTGLMGNKLHAHADQLSPKKKWKHQQSNYNK